MKDIEIFTGPGCAHCQAAKALLKRHGLPFTELDISVPSTMDEFRRRLPRSRSLPQIFADGRHLGNEQDLKLALERRSG